MSNSDILSVQLWFGAGAIAFMAIAMTAAGWNHRYFIRAMFALAALFALAGIVWPRILPLVPAGISDFMPLISNNPISWFVMFLCGNGTVWFIANRKTTRRASENPGNDAWDDNAPLQKVYSRRFVNETVALDGRHFINPTFDNVTLFYQGTGGVFMENPTYIVHNGKMNTRLASRNKVVTMTLKIHDNLLRAAGLPVITMNLGSEATFDAPHLDRDKTP